MDIDRAEVTVERVACNDVIDHRRPAMMQYAETSRRIDGAIEYDHGAAGEVAISSIPQALPVTIRGAASHDRPR